MNWEAIGAIGEVGGAIAVVATLGYLAVQIRQNTKALGSNASQAVTTTSAQMSMGLAQNAELASLLRKAFASSEELDPTERLRVTAFLRGSFRTYENQFYQNQQGFLTELWPGYEGNIRDQLRVPFVRHWWPSQRETFGPAFRDFVDRELAATEPATSVLVGSAGESRGEPQ